MFPKIIIPAVIIILLQIHAYSNQENQFKKIEVWINKNSKTLGYSSIRKKLSNLFQEARKKDLPFEILFIRLKEAVSKKIPSLHLYEVLVKELNTLNNIKSALQDFRECGKKPEDSRIPPGISQAKLYQTRIVRLLNFIRSGVSEKTVLASLKQKCRFNRNYEDIFELFNAIIKIPMLNSLSESELFDLSEALLKSKLNRDSFSSLSSYFLKARINSIDYSYIVKTMIDGLENNGSLIQINNNLFNRSAYR